MNFLNPSLALAGVAAVAVPILIHILMRRKRQPVAWGAMRFLMEAYKRQRRRTNLEQLLLLAARCLVILLLGLAVGKPILGAAASINAMAPRTVYIVIDNSLTSNVRELQGGLTGNSESTLEQLKASALWVVESLDAARGDKVAVITLGGPAEGAILPASSEIGATREILREVPATHAAADWAGAFRLIRDDLTRGAGANDGDVWVAMLSGWRGGSVPQQAALSQLSPLSTSTRRVTLLALSPRTQAVDNVAITNVEPSRSILLTGSNLLSVPSQEASAEAQLVKVTLRRFGPAVTTTGTSKVRLESRIAGASGTAGSFAPVTTAEQVVSWKPGDEFAQVLVSLKSPTLSSIKTTAAAPPVLITARIDEDSVSADNTFSHVVSLRERLEIGIIASGGVGARGGLSEYTPADWFALAISPTADFTLRQRQGGDLRINIIDPQLGIAPSISGGGSGRAAGVLSGLDCIIVPKPQALDALGWRAIREAYEAGALIVLCPNPGDEAQLWTDDFLSAMGVDAAGAGWQLGREAVTRAPGVSLAVSPAVSQAAVDVGGGLSDGGPQGGAGVSRLLGLIAAELRELVRSVTITKLLPITIQDTGSITPLLQTSDGQPILLWVSSMSADPKAANGNGVGGVGGAGGAGARPEENARQSGRSAGGILVFTTALDVAWTDLPARPLLVPLIQELLRQGVGLNNASQTYRAGAGSDVIVNVPPGAVDLARLDLGGTASVGEDETLIPSLVAISASGVTQTPIRHASEWLIRDSSGNTLGATAFHADTTGSATSVKEKSEVSAFLASVSQEITWLDGSEASGGAGIGSSGKGNSGNGEGTAIAQLDSRPSSPPMSLPLLIGALLFALADLIMARFFSHASRDSFIATSQVQAPRTPAPSSNAARAGADASAENKAA